MCVLRSGVLFHIIYKNIEYIHELTLCVFLDLVYHNITRSLSSFKLFMILLYLFFYWDISLLDVFVHMFLKISLIRESNIAALTKYLLTVNFQFVISKISCSVKNTCAFVTLMSFFFMFQHVFIKCKFRHFLKIDSTRITQLLLSRHLFKARTYFYQ